MIKARNKCQMSHRERGPNLPQETIIVTGITGTGLELSNDTITVSIGNGLFEISSHILDGIFYLISVIDNTMLQVSNSIIFHVLFLDFGLSLGSHELP